MTNILMRLRGFLRDQRGNVAMMFGIALVPIIIAAGVGVDYARAALTRSQMSDALDTAALAIGSTPGLTTGQAQTLAAKYFNANYKGDTSGGAVTINTSYDSKGTVTLNITNYQMNTALLKAVGIKTMRVDAASTVVWGQTKLWVALVLDNSGSMSQGDSTGSKMDALQNASKNLLTTLQKAAANEGDVQVAIVPFSDMVNVKGAITSTYLDYREWDAQPPLDSAYMTETTTMSNGIPFQAYGPSALCPFDGTDGYYCTTTGTNNANCSYDTTSGCTSTIPSSGLICPSMHGYSKWTDGSPDRFYNGCYTSTKVTNTKVTWTGKSTDCSNLASGTGCTCTGSGSSKSCSSQKYTHVWTVNPHSGWSGCVTDRQRSGATTYGATAAATTDYDVKNTVPSTGDSLFPTLETNSCLTASVTPLPASWTSAQWAVLSTQIDAMSPGGSTNQAIGIEHGWQALTPGAPYGAPAVPANTSRYLIVFSDGQNTQQARWYGNGRTEGNSADSNIDTRTTTACANAKNDGFIIYTIYVNVGGNSGNSAPLQTCASDSSKYFALTSTSAIVTTFNQIAQQITNVRVSK